MRSSFFPAEMTGFPSSTDETELISSFFWHGLQTSGVGEKNKDKD